MLCNPFNPVGRMLDQVELDQIGETVLRHDLLVVSDEIHCELTFDGRRHLPTAVACPELRDRLVTLMAPGKTFNLAGIGGAVAIISNPELRERFARASSGITGQVNLFSYEVMMAAYRDGEPWRRELIAYLESNRDYLAARIEAMVGITMNNRPTLPGSMSGRLGYPMPPVFSSGAEWVCPMGHSLVGPAS